MSAVLCDLGSSAILEIVFHDYKNASGCMTDCSIHSSSKRCVLNVMLHHSLGEMEHTPVNPSHLLHYAWAPFSMKPIVTLLSLLPHSTTEFSLPQILFHE